MNYLKALAGISLCIATLIGCTPMQQPTSTENDAIANIMARKSVRNYTCQPIEKGKIDTLLRAAMAAPTAVNKQPWAFVVVDDAAQLDTLASHLPYAKMTAEAPLAIVVCGDLTKALRGNNDPYWPLDCSAATENLLLAAEAMGLGAVWTAVYPEEERMEAVSKILGLPEYILPFNVIPIGYPAQPEKPKDKFKAENIHYNKW